jgi:membrane protease YdiL (CAAX protease family)
MQYRNHKGYTGFGQLGILIALVGGGLVLAGLIQMLISTMMLPKGTPVDQMNTAIMEAIAKPENAGLARWMQTAGTFFLLFLPALLFVFITRGRNFFWLGFNKYVGPLQIIIGLVIIFLANMVALPMEDISKAIVSKFPELDRMASQMEETYNTSVKNLARIRSKPELFSAILVMALMPAVFEELFFRSAIQEFLEKWWAAPFTAVIFTSLIFSLIHFSVYLLMSRFILGIALGMMFMYTKNILVNIIAHFVNNTVAVIQFYYIGQKDGEVNLSDLDPQISAWFVIPSSLLLLWLFLQLRKKSAVNRAMISEQESRLLKESLMH